MSIQIKIGIGLVIALLLAFGGSTVVSMTSTAKIFDSISTEYGSTLERAIKDKARNVYDTLEIGVADSLERGEMISFATLLNELSHVKGVLEIGMTDPDAMILYDTVESRKGEKLNNELLSQQILSGNFWESVDGDVITLLRGHMMEADCLRCHFDAKEGDLSGVLFVRYDISELVNTQKQMLSFMDDSTHHAAVTGIGSGVGGLLLALLVVTFLLRKVVLKPVYALQRMLSGLESGDLESRIDLTSRDELGSMATGMNHFAENLRDEVVHAFDLLAKGDLTFSATGVIRHPLQQTNESLSSMIHMVLGTSDDISVKSQQASDNSQQLSQMATESAASLEEISATMAEMSGQIQQNADNTIKATNLMSNTRDVTQTGTQQMNQMMAAMTEISKAGQDIQQIIKVIDEIAFQTNLLALNAAVEAARAGQHGKGFAVVAEEVRNLAVRSAAAAEQTTRLIEDSANKAQNGIRLAEISSDALQKINTAIHTVDQIISDISIASQDQAKGIQEVNVGLSQIDQGIQMSTATAEESAAISEELAGHSRRLRDFMDQFKLPDETKRLS